MKARNKYGWLNCIRNYRFHSIFLKNLLLIFFVLLLPFIGILGVTYYSYNRVQVSEEKAYADEIMSKVTLNVDDLFLTLRDKALLMSYDSDVKMFFIAKSIEDDTFYNSKNIFYFTSLYNISTEAIESIYVYAPNSRSIISEAGRFSYDNFYDKVCIDSWKDNGEKYQTEYMSREVMGAKRTDTLSFFLTTQAVSGIKGVVIINVDIKKLAELLDFGDNVDLMIVNSERVLYDSRGEYMGETIADVDKLMQKSEQEIVVHKQLELSDLELIIRIDSRDIYEKLEVIRNIMYALVGIMLMVSIALVFYISQKIFDPISEILDVIEEDTRLDDRKLLQNQNELSYIKGAIYASISKNKDIEEELLSRIKLLKKAQAVALQAQINPHFVNNTLETINWMTVGRLGVDNDVSDMLNCLSQLLRFSLEDSDTFVTLQEEISYMKKYLFIQRKRLDDSFVVIWDVPVELESCKIIKMSLQPLIENAINYGIIPYSNTGELRIEANRVQDRIYIRVKDSGLGLTEEEAEEINRSIRKQVIKESSHIGLSNVNQRIILAFGEQYGVTVKSQGLEGTTVELELPYQE